MLRNAVSARLGVRVDPVTVGAVLLAVVTGGSDALGGQLWAGVVSLVRRPNRNKPSAEVAKVPSGEAELVALEQTPQDQDKAVALARVLLARGEADEGFGRALVAWWEQASPIRAQVTNAVSGGTQYGPVLQGRDFSNLSFGASSVPPAATSEDRGNR